MIIIIIIIITIIIIIIIIKKEKKSPRGALAPAVVLPYLRVKNILQSLAQVTSPSLSNERRNEYLFNLAKRKQEVSGN